VKLYRFGGCSKKQFFPLIEDQQCMRQLELQTATFPYETNQIGFLEMRKTLLFGQGFGPSKKML
jgi:hypothetical protein